MRMFGGHILMTMRMFDGRIRTTKNVMLCECLMVATQKIALKHHSICHIATQQLAIYNM